MAVESTRVRGCYVAVIAAKACGKEGGPQHGESRVVRLRENG